MDIAWNGRLSLIRFVVTTYFLVLSAAAFSQAYLGPYPGERFEDGPIEQVEDTGVTVGNVRPGGIYEYRYVEDSDRGARPVNVIGGLESDSGASPRSPRNLIRQSMDRWEAASGGTIRWVRCDLDTDDDRFPDCSLDAQGRSAEVVIGIDPVRTSPLGCSLPWKYEHDDERMPMFQGRRMAFNKRSMIAEFNVTHELGHCLGMIHEHQRADRAHWLKFRTFEKDAVSQWREPTRLSPVIENFSYNSPMSYGGHEVDFKCGHVVPRRGLVGKNCTMVGYAPDNAAWSDSTYMLSHIRDQSGRMLIPPEDGSKVKQMHARTHVSRDLYYFNTLANKLPPVVPGPGATRERMLSPRLADNALPVGTPALSARSRGHYDAFVRGSDGNIYWRNYTASDGWARSWTALSSAENVSSDPTATSWSADNTITAFVNKRGAIKFRFSDPSGELTGTSGWLSVGGSLSEAKIPGSQVARTFTRSITDRRTNRLDLAYVGAGLVSRGNLTFDVVAVHRNEHGNGELAINSYDSGTWSGWTYLPLSPRTRSILQRPSVVVNSRGNLLIAATVRNRSTGNCGIMEYEVELPRRRLFSIPGSGTNDPPSIVSHDFNGEQNVECSAPPAIAQYQTAPAPAQQGFPLGTTLKFHDHHIYAVNTSGHPVYRSSAWNKSDYREIGGLPKRGTGVAVTNATTRPSSDHHDMLILMNGADLKQKYTFDANTGELTAPSVQAGGMWFRRWGNIN